jgi:hypothetical protein
MALATVSRSFAGEQEQGGAGQGTEEQGKKKKGGKRNRNKDAGENNTPAPQANPAPTTPPKQ